MAQMNYTNKAPFLKPKLFDEEENMMITKPKNMGLRDDHKAAAPVVDGWRSGGIVAALPKKATTTTEDINESAEAFIRRFRQQLLLERMESVENYEQMLKRGAY